MTWINKSKALKKHISCECKCEFGGRKCKFNQKWNNNKCGCECWNTKIKCMWNPVTCSCENGKYVGSNIDDLVISCDKIIKTTKTIPTKTVPTKVLQ